MPNKVALKESIKKMQGGKCALSSVSLEDNISLIDTDRKTPKAEGGIYLVKNTRVVEPRAHMMRHKTLRIRTSEEEELKALVDDRQQVMKVKNKISNQLLAYKRHTDHPREETLLFLNMQLELAKSQLKKCEKTLVSFIKKLDSPLAKAALGVRSVGPITVAFCLTYIDLEKARHASSLWKYTGLHAPAHQRYTKTKSSGGNKTLRTALYTMADSQVKGRGPYRIVYDRVKARLENSDRIVSSVTTQGIRKDMPWKNTKPSHRHGAALRAIMKHFLADYWYVGRTLAGLPTGPLYPEAVLGGNHRTIMPEEREVGFTKIE